MRLLFASLFVFGAMIAAVALAAKLAPGIPIWLGAPLAAIGFVTLVVMATLLFNARKLKPRTQEEVTRSRSELEQHGLLLRETFRATRAFQIEECEDEGSAYFIELEDHEVLFLTGQYLYEYEPLPPLRARTFPSTEFTIRRHRVNGYAIDIVTSGDVIEPEVIVSPRAEEFQDGEIVRDQTYDELKKERIVVKRHAR